MMMVEDICSRKSVSAKELENLLDWLVSICISDDMTGLFKRVCRHFYYQYPELITDYVYLYKEMYEDDEDRNVIKSSYTFHSSES